MGTPMPVDLAPMFATAAGQLPRDVSRWGFEIKWDGVRALAHVTDKEVIRTTGRRGTDFTDRYPELQVLPDLLPGKSAVLDGEVVAFDGDGRPSFERLQQRMHVSHPDARLTRHVPVHYVVFDLLYLDGHDLLDLPYVARRELLDDLELTAGPIEVPTYLNGEDAGHVDDLLEFTREQGLEGIIAKRLDSRYLPGRRVDLWLKIKNFLDQEVLIGGWKPGKGRRAGGIGSLLIGVPAQGGLHFAGHVGTGFTDAALDHLLHLLAPLVRPESPFARPVPPEVARDVRWVEPSVVGEVSYTAWTAEGRLRTPAWRGLRPDKVPADVEPIDLPDGRRDGE
jgi:bifunctional non-homologous end joining protein LigD